MTLPNFFGIHYNCSSFLLVIIYLKPTDLKYVLFPSTAHLDYVKSRARPVKKNAHDLKFNPNILQRQKLGHPATKERKVLHLSNEGFLAAPV